MNLKGNRAVLIIDDRKIENCLRTRFLPSALSTDLNIFRLTELLIHNEAHQPIPVSGVVNTLEQVHTFDSRARKLTNTVWENSIAYPLVTQGIIADKPDRLPNSDTGSRCAER
jgi:hypothetical protein